MALNTVTCGNCQTENPPDADFCSNCGQPLTGSADESIRESLDAQETDSLFDHGDVRTPGVGLAGGAGGLTTPLLPDDDPDRRETRDW